MGDSPFRPPPQDVTPRIFRKLQVTASPSCSFHQVRDALYCGVRPPLAQLPRCRTPRVLCGHVARVSARDGARAWRGRSSGPFSALSRVSDDSITGSNSCEARARARLFCPGARRLPRHRLISSPPPTCRTPLRPAVMKLRKVRTPKGVARASRLSVRAERPWASARESPSFSALFCIEPLCLGCYLARARR